MTLNMKVSHISQYNGIQWAGFCAHTTAANRDKLVYKVGFMCALTAFFLSQYAAIILVEELTFTAVGISGLSSCEMARNLIIKAIRGAGFNLKISIIYYKGKVKYSVEYTLNAKMDNWSRGVHPKSVLTFNSFNSSLNETMGLWQEQYIEVQCSAKRVKWRSTTDSQ